jgi:hypothetical protein
MIKAKSIQLAIDFAHRQVKGERGLVAARSSNMVER